MKSCLGLIVGIALVICGCVNGHDAFTSDSVTARTDTVVASLYNTVTAFFGFHPSTPVMFQDPPPAPVGKQPAPVSGCVQCFTPEDVDFPPFNFTNWSGRRIQVRATRDADDPSHPPACDLPCESGSMSEHRNFRSTPFYMIEIDETKMVKYAINVDDLFVCDEDGKSCLSITKDFGQHDWWYGLPNRTCIKWDGEFLTDAKCS
eukprot:GFYU01013509.1.p1 GENE.GFYU01013509.1~~GFYU01013509.1.p1  ORF type:complete len:204 (-),score=24.88 GFYU01013509.1:43-654(-)